jgi:DNA-binding CsgD family transcriptional regulator
MLELWKRLLDRLRAPRSPRWRYFALDENLHTALELRADQEKRPAEEIQAELVTEALVHLQTDDWLKQCWDRLSPREQQITALICLQYSNPEMSERLLISENTIKTHISRIKVKFGVHGKAELRQILSGWNFKGWG